MPLFYISFISYPYGATPKINSTLYNDENSYKIVATHCRLDFLSYLSTHSNSRSAIPETICGYFYLSKNSTDQYLK